MDRFVQTFSSRARPARPRSGSPPHEPSTKKLKPDPVSPTEGQAQPVPLHERLPNADSLRTALQWRDVRAENLDLRYAVVFSKSVASELFRALEEEVEYYPREMTRVRVYGKWHDIPMKRVAYGDEGLTYKFSGTCIAARPWLPILRSVRHFLADLTGHQFNFVLINRYKDGHDHIAEHRDDEKELDRSVPIASLSLGQPRDFVLRHAESRGPKSKRRMPPVTVLLEHGSLLLMNPPTNTYWYHSLPVRKRLLHPRINLTFRKLNPQPQ